MKFHLQAATANTITGFGPGWVRIGAIEHRGNVVLDPEHVIDGWASGGFDRLTEHDFARLLDLSPEIVLFGSGVRQRFPHPRLYRALTEAGVGMEIMDTPAACRTYNIIAGEGRRGVAALLVES